MLRGFSSNKELIGSLVKQNYLTCPNLAKVMNSIDRADFVPDEITQYSYLDRPLGIGHSVTISAPHMHAYALEMLKDQLKTAKKTLDVGSGTGYLTLAFAKAMLLAGTKEVKSYGIEHIPELVKSSIVNIQKNHAELIDNKVVEIFEGDGRKGLEEYGPYDCIHVGAAIYIGQGVVEKLVDQLAVGGRLVAPVGTEQGQLFITYDRQKDGSVVKEEHLGVVYVPLTSKEKQLQG